MLPYDPDKAAEMLDAAGYEKGSDGKRTMPDGSPLSVDFSVQAGFIDYEAIAEVVADNLNDLGVDTKVTASAPESVDEQKKTGDFNVMLEYLHGGCELARNLGSKLSSKQFPTEQDILPNVGRYSDPATDEAIEGLSGATDREEQKPFLGELVDVMMTEYPVTALIYAPSRTIYRTENAVGLADRGRRLRQRRRRPAPGDDAPDAAELSRSGALLPPEDRVLPRHPVGRRHPQLPHPAAAAGRPRRADGAQAAGQGQPARRGPGRGDALDARRAGRLAVVAVLDLPRPTCCAGTSGCPTPTTRSRWPR